MSEDPPPRRDIAPIRTMMALRSGEALKAFRVWGVMALICLLIMPPPMAVAWMVLSAVALLLLRLWRLKERAQKRRSFVVHELERRGLKPRTITEHGFGGLIEFVADDPSGQQVRGALRGDDFTIDERHWVN